jgi:hypothetical protein
MGTALVLGEGWFERDAKRLRTLTADQIVGWTGAETRWDTGTSERSKIVDVLRATR